MAVSTGWRAAVVAAGASLLAVPTAAPANFFWKAPDMSGAPVRGDEPELHNPLPGATPAELQASLVWMLRAGLNVGALQCQFDPTLLASGQYNHVIDYHRVELGKAYQTLEGYFKRTKKPLKAAQNAFDQYGTRTYSRFSAVSSQYTFCETVSKIGRAALFVPKGQFHTVAEKYLSELRNSLNRHGEQRFTYQILPIVTPMPPLDDKCWDKKGELDTRRCPFAF